MRKIISLLLCIAMLLSMGAILTACNGDTATAEGQENQDNSDAANDSPENTEETPSDEENGGNQNGSEGNTEELYPNPDPEIEFITYNVAYYQATAGNMTVYYDDQSLSDYTVAERAPRLYSLVEHYKPDVLALQEVNRLWWPYIVSNEDSIINAFGYEWEGNLGCFRSKNGKGTQDIELYNLLLWDPEKFEKIDSGITRFNPNIAGNANKDRMVTWAILKNKTTGVESMFASTHLCTQGNDELKKLNVTQAETLTTVLKKYAGNRAIIVGGDFNASETSKAYRQMISSSFKDTRYEAAVNLTPSMGSTRFWGKNDDWQVKLPIDHIFYFGSTKYTVDTYSILYDTFDKDDVISRDVSLVGINYDLSDHLGVYAKFVEKGTKK